MKQRHGYHRLLYHLVFHTKHREHLIADRNDEKFLFDAMKVKAHQMDSYIEEFGAWKDHVHVFVRSVPALALVELYKGLKGFSSTLWRQRKPERPFGWGDSAYSVTVDPDNCEVLRDYIRNQWKRHEERSTINAYEREDN